MFVRCTAIDNPGTWPYIKRCVNEQNKMHSVVYNTNRNTDEEDLLCDTHYKLYEKAVENKEIEPVAYCLIDYDGG